MYSTVHEYIKGNVYVVLVPYFLGDIGWVDAQVLIVGNIGAKVEIGDVNTKVAVAAACVGNGAVDVHFGIGH